MGSDQTENIPENIPVLSPEERAREVRRLLIQTVGELGQGLRILADDIKHGRLLGAWSTLQTLAQLVSMQDALVKELPRV